MAIITVDLHIKTLPTKNLKDLSDVVCVGNLKDGMVLAYDGSTKKWVPRELD